MEPGQYVLPTLATIALGTALLVPLRDDRLGRRATLGGADPLRPDFRVVGGTPEGIATGAADDPLVARNVDVHLGDDAHLDRDADGAHDPELAALKATGLPPDATAEISAPATTPPVIGSHTEPAKDLSGAPYVRYLDGSAIGETHGAAAPLDSQSDSPESADIDSRSQADVRDLGASVGIVPEKRRGFRGFMAWLFGITSGSGTHAVGHDLTHVAVSALAATQATAPRDGANVDSSAYDTTTIERSFGSELSQLLAPPASSTQVDLGTEPRERERACEPFEAPLPEQVVSRLKNGVDRVVPLTRLPLRPQIEDVTWPARLNPPRVPCSYDQRHAVLASLGRERPDSLAGVLEFALSQEDRVGRILALRALARTLPTSRTRVAFLDTLRIGTDEERAIALDALAMHGEREDLVIALGDRVDAIAAQAALAYVGSDRRDDYRNELARHVDSSRIESILLLLAGIVE